MAQTPDTLLFTQEEWDAAIPGVVDAMKQHLSGYRTAVYEHKLDAEGKEYGDGWGSGSYVRLHGQVFILTNEHVAAVRADGRVLIHQFAGQEDLRRVVGNHVEYGYPLDLALLPVDMQAWNAVGHATLGRCSRKPRATPRENSISLMINAFRRAFTSASNIAPT